MKTEGRLTVEQKTVTFSDEHREHTFNTSQESGSSSYLDSTEQSVPTSIDQLYQRPENLKVQEPVVTSSELINRIPNENYTNGYGTERPKSPSIQDASTFPTAAIKPEVPSDRTKEEVPPGMREDTVSALKEFEPPNTEGMSKARIRWLAAFNKIVSEMVEVSFSQFSCPCFLKKPFPSIFEMKAYTFCEIAFHGELFCVSFS